VLPVIQVWKTSRPDCRSTTTCHKPGFGQDAAPCGAWKEPERHAVMNHGPFAIPVAQDVDGVAAARLHKSGEGFIS
jgi:hypothetical protein